VRPALPAATPSLGSLSGLCRVVAGAGAGPRHARAKPLTVLTKLAAFARPAENLAANRSKPAKRAEAKLGGCAQLTKYPGWLWSAAPPGNLAARQTGSPRRLSGGRRCHAHVLAAFTREMISRAVVLSRRPHRSCTPTKAMISAFRPTACVDLRSGCFGASTKTAAFGRGVCRQRPFLPSSPNRVPAAEVTPTDIGGQDGQIANLFHDPVVDADRLQVLEKQRPSRARASASGPRASRRASMRSMPCANLGACAHGSRASHMVLRARKRRTCPHSIGNFRWLGTPPRTSRVGLSRTKRCTRRTPGEAPRRPARCSHSRSLGDWALMPIVTIGSALSDLEGKAARNRSAKTPGSSSIR